MRNFMILNESLNYIEQNLCEPITRTDIAECCYVSLSSLEKLFRYALHISIKDYISRRRMTRAAKDVAESGMSVMDIAMKYQYNSGEVFSRTFKKVWGVNPSEFKRNWKFTGIFPKLEYEYNEREGGIMARRKVDMSEAYDFLKERRGSYILCFDIRNLTTINGISTKAGDIAILEAARRIDGAASDDMMLIRIGGDEFALVTGLYEEAEVRLLGDRVLESNGLPIICDGREIPLSLWCGATVIPEHLRYSELYGSLQESIDRSKK